MRARATRPPSADQDAVRVRVARGGEPVGHAELAVEVPEVELHRLLGHPELLADRLVREPARQRLEHRDLARREARIAQCVVGPGG